MQLFGHARLLRKFSILWNLEPVASTDGVGPREVRLVNEVHSWTEFGVDIEGCFFEGEGHADRDADSEPVTVFPGDFSTVANDVPSAAPVSAISYAVDTFAVFDDHVSSPAVVAVFDPSTDVECEASDIPIAEGEFVDVLCVEVEVTSAVPASPGDEVDGASLAQSDLECWCDDGPYGEPDSEFPVERTIGRTRDRCLGVIRTVLRLRVMACGELGT